MTGDFLDCRQTASGRCPSRGAQTTKVKEGDNTLRYSTWVKKATGGTLKEGDFTAVANFNLAYE